MLQSRLFGKTLRNDPSDETAVNARLLTRAGFIAKEISGVYNFLPLGLRVIEKISSIVRDEMNKAGAEELSLSALQNKENWEKTRRWKSFEALFKVKSRYGFEYALGPTHEEVIVPLAKQFIHSYKDLPLAVYQIQTKFRDEPRAKSGILRGREFLMKDLYSFHADEKDFERYYKRIKDAYRAIFKRCGIDAIETEAGGGDFSDASHEYQVLSDNGEDTIFYCEMGDWAENKEISRLRAGARCPRCSSPIKAGKSIEVGNIFPLKTRFSEAFSLTYNDSRGEDKLVLMGCYGLGISRFMGALVEVYHDKEGIIWPDAVAPFRIHLLCLGKDAGVKKYCEKLYHDMLAKGVEVLYDDRDQVTHGEKFNDADLIGIPNRVVVSERTIAARKVEFKRRNSKIPQYMNNVMLLKKIMKL